MSSTLVANCPRCGANQQTFNIRGTNILKTQRDSFGINSREIYQAEIYSVCRYCHLGTVFKVKAKNDIDSESVWNEFINDLVIHDHESINDIALIASHISLKDMSAEPPPEHVPEITEKAFKEASGCLSCNFPNAAGSMFRTCLDLTAKDIINQNTNNTEAQKLLNKKLKDKIDGLLTLGLIPNDLIGLAKCIRENGNDGTHDCSLDEETASALKDFTKTLLESIYTRKKKIELMEAKRKERKTPSKA